MTNLKPDEKKFWRFKVNKSQKSCVGIGIKTNPSFEIESWMQIIVWDVKRNHGDIIISWVPERSKVLREVRARWCLTKVSLGKRLQYWWNDGKKSSISEKQVLRKVSTAKASALPFVGCSQTDHHRFFTLHEAGCYGTYACWTLTCLYWKRFGTVSEEADLHTQPVLNSFLAKTRLLH